MLVAEGSRRSNLRVLYGILAQSALQGFNTASVDSHREAYLLNLIRLLEMYRHDTLRQPSHRAVLDRRESNPRESSRELLEAQAVERALRAAHESAYPNLTKDEVVERLKGVFSQVIRNKAAVTSRAEVELAKRFLEAFAAALRS